MSAPAIAPRHPTLALLLPLLLAVACVGQSAAESTSERQAAGQVAPAADAAATDSLVARLRTIAARTGGRVGIAALHLPSGQQVAVDGDLPVFMSSVVKLPLAVQLLARVDRGELRLGDSLTLAARDMRVGQSGIAARHPMGGLTLTVRELLRLAVAESDNSASDALLRYSGGAGRATAELRRLELHGVRIDRSYAENTWQFTGVDTPPPEAQWTHALMDSLTSAVPAERRAAAGQRFLADERDHITANGAVALLARLARGELLSRASRAVLLADLTDTRNPDTRIVAGVPAGTAVAHKTGTWLRVRDTAVAVNDVGLVTLPDGGQLALAILVRGGTVPTTQIDAAMAAITRELYAHWAPAASVSAAVGEGGHE